MKIAYLVNQYPNASCTFIRREIQALEKHGAEINRYAIRPGPIQVVDGIDHEEQKKTKYILDDKIGLIKNFLWFLTKRPSKVTAAFKSAFTMGRRSDRGLATYLFYVLEACTLTRWLEEDGVEHVHAHFGTNSATLAYLAKTLGGPEYSFTVHGPDEFDAPRQMSLGRKVEASKFTVAISSFGRSQLYRFCSYKHWSKVKVVHCGLDESYLTGETSPVPDVAQFVSIGRIHEQKGYGVLIEAIKILAAKDIVFKVRILGDGPLRAEITEELKTAGIESYVDFLGWADDKMVKEEIRNARAMLLPSFAEGLPVVFMESFALGRPVITTAIAGIPELIEPDVCGWIVPAGSPEALADAIEESLKTSTDELTNMGLEGQRRVREQHSASKEAEKLLEHFSA